MFGLGISHLVLVGLIGSYALLFSSAGSIQSCYQDITRGFQPSESCNLEGYWQPWYQWSTHSIPLATSLALGFCFCEILTCAAIGVTSSIVLGGHRLSLLLALFVRFLPVTIFSLWPDYPWAGAATTTWMFRWREYTWFSLADSGTSAIMRTVLGAFYGYDQASRLSIIATGAFF